MPLRCKPGELVIVDQKSYQGQCACFLGMTFVTKFLRRRTDGNVMWKLATRWPACIHHRVAGVENIYEVHDSMCRPIRPDVGPGLRRHNYWPYPPNPPPTFSGRTPPPASMHQPV